MDANELSMVHDKAVALLIIKDRVEKDFARVWRRFNSVKFLNCLTNKAWVLAWTRDFDTLRRKVSAFFRTDFKSRS